MNKSRKIFTALQLATIVRRQLKGKAPVLLIVDTFQAARVLTIRNAQRSFSRAR
jgi:hypothetical protein